MDSKQTPHFIDDHTLILLERDRGRRIEIRIKLCNDILTRVAKFIDIF